MYFIDFLKHFFRKANVGSILFMLLNWIITSGILMLYLRPLWAAPLVGLALYVVGLAVMMSPFGEWLFRILYGCKKINRLEYKERLLPIFESVYQKAKRQDAALANDIKLFLKEDDAPNAFAVGRKTVCVTTGLMNFSDEQIAAALAHEFGHLLHKDTDRNILISVGNAFINAYLMVIRLWLVVQRALIRGLEWFLSWFPFGFLFSWLMWIYTEVTFLINFIFLDGFTFVWTMIGKVLVLQTDRACEFESDRFAYELGYGNPLCALLEETYFSQSTSKGLMATLLSSHPSKDERIGKLQSYGATYRNPALCS